MELSDKVALVTGSTGGIGAETARLMAAAGAEVVVSGRNAERGAATVRSITDTGGKARFVAADLTDPAALRCLAEAAGPVDILVNNAAIFPGRRPWTRNSTRSTRASRRTSAPRTSSPRRWFPR